MVTAPGTLRYVLTSGATKWEDALHAPVPAPATVAADGSVYFGCNTGKYNSDAMAVGLNPAGVMLFTSTKSYCTFTTPPVVLSDGSVVFEFDDFSYRGDVFPIELASCIRRVDPTGKTLLQVPATDVRWGEGKDLGLTAPGLVNGKYAAFSYENAFWLIDAAGHTFTTDQPTNAAGGYATQVAAQGDLLLAATAGEYGTPTGLYRLTVRVR